MTARLVYVNGRYCPASKATVSFQDRGYQFADGIYEVIALYKGQYVDEQGHLDRLERSMELLHIDNPFSSRAGLKTIIDRVVRGNLVKDGLVYIQVTRGSAVRDHAFPKKAVKPSVVIVAKPMNYAKFDALAEKGAKVITYPDQRWDLCHIKTISLLPNVLAKQTALQQGANEAWLYDENGFITEGSSSNAWIVTTDGRLKTRPKGNEILAGITRQTVMELCEREGLIFDETPFTVTEAKQAQEAFMTSATQFVMPIVQIDDVVLGDGKTGQTARRLRDLYKQNASAL